VHRNDPDSASARHRFFNLNLCLPACRRFFQAYDGLFERSADGVCCCADVNVGELQSRRVWLGRCVFSLPQIITSGRKLHYLATALATWRVRFPFFHLASCRLKVIQLFEW